MIKFFFSLKMLPVHIIVLAVIIGYSIITYDGCRQSEEYDAGVDALVNKDYNKGVRLIKANAAKHDVKKRFLVDQIYSRGLVTDAEDGEVNDWFSCKDSYDGCVPGEPEYYAGLRAIYKTGFGKVRFSRDYKTALHWIQKAADKGYPEAKEWLAFHKKLGFVDAIQKQADVPVEVPPQESKK